MDKICGGAGPGTSDIIIVVDLKDMMWRDMANNVY